MEQTSINQQEKQRTQAQEKMEESIDTTIPEDRNFLYNTLVTFLSKKNVATLSDEICKVFASLLKAREAALFLEDGQSYRIRGSLGIHKKRVAAVSLSRTSPFIQKLKNLKKTLVFKKQGDFSLEEFQIFYLRKALTRFMLDYVIILKDNRRFMGFIILGKSTDEGKELTLNPKDTHLATHLSKQAVVVIEQKIFFDQFQQMKNELKRERQMKEYLFDHAEAGVAIIEYSTKRVEYLNGFIKTLFALEGEKTQIKSVKIVGKKIDEIIKRYQAHPFSHFLNAYKEAKFSRRSLKKPIFYTYHSENAGLSYEINSIFLKRETGGAELIVIKKSE